MVGSIDTGRRYREFADREARGTSPSLECWARAVADNADLQTAIATLPKSKQQPNLVFAAARWHGAEAGDTEALRLLVLERFSLLRRTILSRSTQTNEPARGAALTLGLSRISGPIALIEIGAAAGLCLVLDQYSYRFSDGSRIDPLDGPSRVQIDIDVDVDLEQGVTPTSRMPFISWRRGLDLHPLDPGDPDAQAWLTTLIWPEHQTRLRRLRPALELAARSHVRIEAGSVLEDLPRIVATCPPGSTVVCMNSATLTYMTADYRQAAVELIYELGARWLSFEARGIAPGVAGARVPVDMNTRFVAALDGQPFAVANSHGDHLTLLPSSGVSATRPSHLT